MPLTNNDGIKDHDTLRETNSKRTTWMQTTSQIHYPPRNQRFWDTCTTKREVKFTTVRQTNSNNTETLADKHRDWGNCSRTRQLSLNPPKQQYNPRASPSEIDSVYVPRAVKTYHMDIGCIHTEKQSNINGTNPKLQPTND